MDEAPKKPVKTRWGCLALPICFIIFVIIVLARSYWYENQPESLHLRDVFSQSGFEIPQYVTEIDGDKGFVDFHGDYIAFVSFSVHPEDIEQFMHLPEKSWKNPSDFKPLNEAAYIESWTIPAGAFMIEDRRPEQQLTRKYAVDRKTNRVYFYRGST